MLGGATKATKKREFVPYGRSIGSWICLTHKTYQFPMIQISGNSTCLRISNFRIINIYYTGKEINVIEFPKILRILMKSRFS
jgi:hypothetical protein